jgi:hypothetical protein
VPQHGCVNPTAPSVLTDTPIPTDYLVADAVRPNRSAEGGAESPRFSRHPSFGGITDEVRVLAPERGSEASRCGWETSLFNALRMDAERGRADFTMEANTDALSTPLEGLSTGHRRCTDVGRTSRETLTGLLRVLWTGS